MKRPPKFVQAFIDQHGRPRFYFRRPGFPRVPLPGLPWSPEFMAAYETALAGQPVQVGAGRLMPGTIRALAVSYFNSPAFRSMSRITQQDYRYAIERFCQEHGDKRAAALQREHIIKLMAGRKPNSANRLRKVLRAMMTHAVEIGIRADDPTREVKAVRIKSDGYHSWTEAEIAQFEARHPEARGHGWRWPVALYRPAPCRCRTSRPPAHPRRRDADQAAEDRRRACHPGAPRVAGNDLWRDRPSDFPGERWGRPFTVGSFSNWFRAQCDMANLPHCSAHGLRKAAARRLAEAGCTAHEIAAITGHASLREVARYTRAADQRRLAGAAMEKTKKRTSIVKPAIGFDNNEKIS